jgi:endoglucanase
MAIKHSKAMEKDVLELSNLPGASGHEEEVAKVLKKKLQRIPGIKFDKDNLGSLMAIKKGTGGKNAPLISLDAHMDEVAFMLSDIDSKGFIKMEPLGG